jgi:hypothetical protein
MGSIHYGSAPHRPVLVTKKDNRLEEKKYYALGGST